MRDILNGEERSFFTKLFAEHAGQLGEIKQGQKDIKEDIHDINKKISHIEEKLDRVEKETPTKREVAHTINFMNREHIRMCHDKEKVLGGFLFRNKKLLIKVLATLLIIGGSALGISGAVGAI